MSTTDSRIQRRFKLMNIAQIAVGVVALVGLVIYGLPSPEERPKVYELYLAGIWGLMTLSCITAYTRWGDTGWLRRIIAIAAPAVALLYLFEYVLG